MANSIQRAPFSRVSLAPACFGILVRLSRNPQLKLRLSPLFPLVWDIGKYIIIFLSSLFAIYTDCESLLAISTQENRLVSFLSVNLSLSHGQLHAHRHTRNIHTPAHTHTHTHFAAIATLGKIYSSLGPTILHVYILKNCLEKLKLTSHNR